MSKKSRIRWFMRIMDAISFFRAKTVDERDVIVQHAYSREKKRREK